MIADREAKQIHVRDVPVASGGRIRYDGGLDGTEPPGRLRLGGQRSLLIPQAIHELHIDFWSTRTRFQKVYSVPDPWTGPDG